MNVSSGVKGAACHGLLRGQAASTRRRNQSDCWWFVDDMLFDVIFFCCLRFELLLFAHPIFEFCCSGQLGLNVQDAQSVRSTIEVIWLQLGAVGDFGHKLCGSLWPSFSRPRSSCWATLALHAGMIKWNMSSMTFREFVRTKKAVLHWPHCILKLEPLCQGKSSLALRFCQGRFNPYHEAAAPTSNCFGHLLPLSAGCCCLSLSLQNVAGPFLNCRLSATRKSASLKATLQSFWCGRLLTYTLQVWRQCLYTFLYFGPRDCNAAA